VRAECLGEQVAQLGELELTDGQITQSADIPKGFRPKIETTKN
jgi:hypothetical protein